MVVVCFPFFPQRRWAPDSCSGPAQSVTGVVNVSRETSVTQVVGEGPPPIVSADTALRQWSAGSVTPVRTAVSFSRLVGVNDNNQQTTPQETSRADRFIAAFNGIEQTLREELGVPPGVYFTEVVKKARRTHIITEDIAESLFAYARLRNAISHDRYKNGEPIADPRPDVVAEIEGIRTIVTADTRVVSVLGHTEVVTLSPDTHLDEVLKVVRTTGYARFPVYDRGSFVYLLTVQAIAKWLANDVSDNNSIDATTVADVREYLSDSDRAEIAPKDLTAPQALARFNNLDDSGHSPAALIITEQGKKSQRPIQIIVASDIPKLLAAVDY